jgi:hypothetical protein
VAYSLAGFACGSKVGNDLILPDFCPQGKNLEELDQKYRCERAMWG